MLVLEPATIRGQRHKGARASTQGRCAPVLLKVPAGPKPPRALPHIQLLLPDFNQHFLSLKQLREGDNAGETRETLGVRVHERLERKTWRDRYSYAGTLFLSRTHARAGVYLLLRFLQFIPCVLLPARHFLL